MHIEFVFLEVCCLKFSIYKYKSLNSPKNNFEIIFDIIWDTNVKHIKQIVFSQAILKLCSLVVCCL